MAETHEIFKEWLKINKEDGHPLGTNWTTPVMDCLKIESRHAARNLRMRSWSATTKKGKERVAMLVRMDQSPRARNFLCAEFGHTNPDQGLPATTPAATNSLDQGTTAAHPVSDYLRECASIIDAGQEALDGMEQAQAYQVALDGLGPLTDKEQRAQLRLATWNRWHWQILYKDAVRQVEEQADRLLEIDEDIERLKLPENLVEAAFRLDHLEEIRPQEARLLELRDGLQSTRRLAMEAWAAVADWLRLETEIALYKRALADMGWQDASEIARAS
jgi:hypothetical protein